MQNGRILPHISPLTQMFLRINRYLSVVVVNRQMPWVELCWDRMDAGGTGEGLCVGLHTNTHTHPHDLHRFRALVRR